MHPAVITSRVAKDEFERIKGMHADILTGMANQRMMIDQNNQQKAAAMQNENVMKNEMDQAKMVNDTAANKNYMDFATKNAELDIKRAALAA